MSMDETWKDGYAIRMRGEDPKRYVVGMMHYVESIIGDRAVMYCGRQMPKTNKSGTLTKVGGGWAMCHTCSKRTR